MKFKKKILATLVAAAMSSAALADNVLIIGGEGDSYVSVKTELEAVGHTVTYQNTTAGPTDLTGYQQVWDMRYSTALSANDMLVYDTFLKNHGYLYLSGEHGGFAVRNNSISSFTSSLGGGTISVNGFASNEQTGNTTYFIGNETVDYAAAAIITAQGGRVLSKDASNNATAMMWVGNAGDLGQDYNGTVVVVADINWTQSSFYDANNEAFLERLIGGIVAGTVAGTISDQGNGAAGGGNGTPPAPTTFSVTNTGETVVTDTMAAGTFTGNGGVLQAATGTTALANDISLSNPGMTFDGNGQTISLTGAISGTGGLTLSNGTTSLDGTYTYTGATTISSGATVINNSNISSSSQVTNLGTFTNNGTTGNWVNGFDGAGNTATLTNNGTMGNGTNYSTFNNNGTTGSVTNRGTFNNNAAGTTGNVVNAGTFNNYGDTGTVNNMGVFTNQAGGTVTELVYNNHVVRNYGTLNSITYQGGSFTNYAGGTVGSINTTQAHGSFSNQGTITGNVTTNSNNFTNTATGVVQGTYTNSGTLRNYGTLGTVTNTGTLTTYANSTTGAVTTSGTFTNAGTTGAVTLNGGSFANTGTVASVDNTTGMSLTNNGTITGDLTNIGTVASLTNNGTIGNVTGTVTSVTNTGTMTNSGTVDTGTNSGWFTNAVNAVVGFFTNSGTAVNNGTVNSVTNTGTYANNGTTGDWDNSNEMANAGTMGNGTNSGTMVNTGTLGNVTNTGTFTSNGNIGAMTNSGTFNYVGGTVDSYAQSAGTTVIDSATPLAVTNGATLGGGLAINNAPTAYGKYTVVSASSVTGTYDSLTSAGTNDYLKYSGTDVKLYVTPNATATQSSINAVAGSLGNATNLVSSTVTGGLGNDCGTFGENGACISLAYGQSLASTGDLQTGGATVAKKLGPNWRAGVFVNAPFNSTSVGSIGVKSNEAFGGFIGWNQNADGSGLGVTASAATGKGKLTITRNGPEVGTGVSDTETNAYQVKATYAKVLSETVTVTPYAGVRYSDTSFSGYTEQGPVFPLTVNATSKKSVDLLAGVSIANKFTDKLTGSVSAGIVQNLGGQSSPASYTGTSEIGGLTTFSGNIPSNGDSNPAFGAGLSYSIDSTTKVGVNAGWQAKGSNADITSYGVTFTKGF